MTTETSGAPAETGLEEITVRPLGLQSGDVVLRVDKRADGSLCCLTVLRRSP